MMPADSRSVRVERIEAAVLPMARAALDAGQVQTARRLYARLLEVDPASAEARMGIGDIHMLNREVRQAAMLYRAAIDHARVPAVRHAALLAHARAALAAGDAEAARDSFGRLTDPAEGAADPEAAWGWNGIGVLRLLDGNAREAVAAFEQAVLRDPGESRFHENLVRAVAIIEQIVEPAAEVDAPDGPLPVSEEPGPETRDDAADDAVETVPPSPAGEDAPQDPGAQPLSDDADADAPPDDPGTAPSPGDGPSELLPQGDTADAAKVLDDEPRDEAPETPSAGDPDDAHQEDEPPAPLPDDDAEDATADADPDSLLVDDAVNDLAQDDLADPVPDAVEDVRAPPLADDAEGATETILADDRPEESAELDPDILLPDDAEDDLSQDDMPATPSPDDDPEDATDDDPASISTDDQADESAEIDADILFPDDADDDPGRDDAPDPVGDADVDVRVPAVAGDEQEDATEGDVIVADDWPDESVEVNPDSLLADDAVDDLAQDDVADPVGDADVDVRVPSVDDGDAEGASEGDAEPVLGDDRGDGAAGIDADILFPDDVDDDPGRDDLGDPVGDADVDVRVPAVDDGDAEGASEGDAEPVLGDDQGDGAAEIDADILFPDDVDDDLGRDDLADPVGDADVDVRVPTVAGDDAEGVTDDDAGPGLADERGDESVDIDPDTLLADDVVDDLAQDDVADPVGDADEDVRVPTVASDDTEDAPIDDAVPVLADESVDVDPGTLPADDVVDDLAQDDLGDPVEDADVDVRVPTVADGEQEEATDGDVIVADDWPDESVAVDSDALAADDVVDDLARDDLGDPVEDADVDVRVPTVADGEQEEATAGEVIVVDDWPDESVEVDPDSLAVDDAVDDLARDDLGDSVQDADGDVRVPTVADGEQEETTAGDVVVADDWPDESVDVDSDALGADDVVDDLARDDLGDSVQDADGDVRVPTVADGEQEEATAGDVIVADDWPDESVEVDPDSLGADDAVDDLARGDLGDSVQDADGDVRVPTVADGEREEATAGEVIVADDWPDESVDVDSDALGSDDVVDDLARDDLGDSVQDADEDVRVPPVASEELEGATEGEVILADERAAESVEIDAVDDPWQDDLPDPVPNADVDVRLPPLLPGWLEDAADEDVAPAVDDDPPVGPAEDMIGEAPLDDDVPAWLLDDVVEDATPGDLDVESVLVDSRSDGDLGADEPLEDDVPPWLLDDGAEDAASRDMDVESVLVEPVDSRSDGDLGAGESIEDDVPAWLLDDVAEDATSRDMDVESVLVEPVDSRSDGDLGAGQPVEDDVPAWLLDDVVEDATSRDMDVESVLVEPVDSRSDGDLGADEPFDDDAPAFDTTVTVADEAPPPAEPGGVLSTGFVVETDEGRFVQVGAYIEGVRADVVATGLRDRTDLPVVIQPADRDGRLFFLVRIGPVPPGGLPDDLADEFGIRNEVFAPLLEQALPVVVGDETYLQVGVYADRDAADGVAAQARTETGYPVRVHRLERQDGTPLYRVRVGPVDSEDD